MEDVEYDDGLPLGAVVAEPAHVFGPSNPVSALPDRDDAVPADPPKQFPDPERDMTDHIVAVNWAYPDLPLQVLADIEQLVRTHVGPGDPPPLLLLRTSGRV